MRPKRLLFLLHRWFGVAMCVLFALWFASGMVMMYVEYPELTEHERLDMLPVLDAARITITAAEAASRVGIERPERMVLTSVTMRPAYLLDGTEVVFADTGERFGGTDRVAALAAVAASGFGSGPAGARYEGPVAMDQWTVSEVLEPHRPLHRVSVGDGAGTMVYVSDRTGQIVRDTTRRERLWNWVGSTVHWIYPMQLRQYRSVWVNLIIYISLAGIVSVATGAVIGLLRLRLRRRYRGRSVSPYRGFAKWHHVLGLVSLVFVSTFIFSGLMSMTPWGIFDSRMPAAPQIARFAGGPGLELDRFPSLESNAVARDAKEVEWLQIGGQGHLVISRSAEDRRVTFDGSSAARKPRALTQRIERALPAFLPDADVASISVLSSYDDYYYSRHNRYRPLPVYRVEFDDDEETWFDVDASTGQVVLRHTDRSRLGRWLYNGLHSLDFRFLLDRGPLWDVTLVGLSLIGLAFSVTSAVLGWRRLRRAAMRPLAQKS